MTSVRGLALRLTRLDHAMGRSSGHPSILIGLLDGPVAAHPDLRGVSSDNKTSSRAAVHGTLVAGVLVAQRGSGAPGICPSCRLVVRPIFETDGVPNTDPAMVADRVVECVDAGARLLNISAAYVMPSSVGNGRLTMALDHAASRGAIVVVAAGITAESRDRRWSVTPRWCPLPPATSQGDRCRVRTWGHQSGGVACLHPASTSRASRPGEGWTS